MPQTFHRRSLAPTVRQPVKVKALLEPREKKFIYILVLGLSIGLLFGLASFWQNVDAIVGLTFNGLINGGIAAAIAYQTNKTIAIVIACIVVSTITSVFLGFEILGLHNATMLSPFGFLQGATLGLFAYFKGPWREYKVK